LLEFFPKNVKKVELLYRASDHNFSIQKYFELCGSVQSTAIICETNKDRIIGGYTPFAHNIGSGSSAWVADSSGSSFLFSITNNDKFKLTATNNAIIQNPSKDSIRFGNN
jgi:hypothetical protein